MLLSSGAVATVLATVTFFALPGSPPVVVDSFSSLGDASTGVGWGVHPDSTDTAGLTFVEGPATPPLGRGSLELYTPAMSDRVRWGLLIRPGLGIGANGSYPLA